MQFEPETLRVLRAVLEDAWSALPADRRHQTSKALLAERILKAAASGERDPARLRARAVKPVAGAAGDTRAQRTL